MTPPLDDETGPETGPETGSELRADSGERYERGERIATGGMGEVWRARDTVLGREVAVKILKREYAEDPTFRARFEAEARHAAGLHHPGIASVFDYGLLKEGHTPYLVMELVHGKPLSDLIVGQPFDPEQARLLALQTAEALAVAHAAGVVHRDVKPGNLLVTPEGQVKITDFGIARATGSVAFTQTGQIVGTPQYLSPEQARGESATAASDVYSLGIVMFEILSGRRPFVADTPIATALAQIQQDVPPLPEGVPAGLAQIVMHALAKNPAQRYANGAELATALRGAADPAAPVVVPVAAALAGETSVLPAAAGGVGLATPLSSPTITDTTDTTDTTDVAPATATATATATDRSRWPLYAGALVVLILLAALLVAHPWTNDPATTQTDTTQPQTSDTVRVRPKAYLGLPVEDVVSALRAKGLTTKVVSKDNPDGQEADTVADLSPTGLVKKGTTITVVTWAQPSTDAPTDQPGDQPTPTEPAPTESAPTEGAGQDSSGKPTKAPKAPKATKPEKSQQPGKANKQAAAPSAGSPTKNGN